MPSWQLRLLVYMVAGLSWDSLSVKDKEMGRHYSSWRLFVLSLQEVRDQLLEGLDGRLTCIFSELKE